MTPPADIPTRFMAEWLWRCLVECNNSGIKDAVPFYAARLKAVMNDPRYLDKEAA